MIIRAPTHWLGASAVTVWPAVFVSPKVVGLKSALRHERVHLAQQRRWALYGLGVGLLVWFALYLFALPVWRNPWRERWEREAYGACGYSERSINRILRRRPYYLWGIGERQR